MWLTYRLGAKLLGDTAGLFAAGLTLTSPFFLMNSGSLLSHPLGLVLSAAFVLAWLDLTGTPDGRIPPWVLALAAGLSLGLLALTRPLTAVALAVPFGLHGMRCWRGAAGRSGGGCWRWARWPCWWGR